MRRIEKQREPRALLEYRLREGAAWDGDNAFASLKGILREGLVKEQRGLCCYCMRRIDASADKMTIEHWAPRARRRDLELDWQNLLGVCPGDVNAPAKVQHCDRAKGDADIQISPLNARHMSELSSTANGRVMSQNPEHNEDIERRLNLNTPNLCHARKKALEGYQQAIRQRSLKKDSIDARLNPPSSGPLPEYWGVIEYWLKRRQQRHG